MRKFYPFAKLMQMTAKTLSSRLALIFLFGLLAFSAGAQTTRYVNAAAAGANNGTSWANAYTSLQSALSAAVSGDEIRVAAGKYLPSVDPDGTATMRKQTFLLKSGVKLYGGYNATTGARDVKANKTILSGDLDNNDMGFTNNTNNAYHVVAVRNLAAATMLDGFTITGGNGNNSGSFLVEGVNDMGSAVYLYGGGTHLTVNNCVIEGNVSTYGAFAIRDNTSPTVSNCVFANNSGRAVYGQGNSSGTASYVNCLFVGNTGSAFMFYGGGAINIVNSTFYGNSGDNPIFGTNGAALTVTNSIVWGNTKSGSPAGIQINTCCSPTGTVSYSAMDVAGTGYTGSNNISAGPAFDNAADPDGADNIWMTADDGLHLRAASPAANSGNDGAVSVATDITGAVRKQGVVNMGAYETLITKTSQTITFSAGASVTKVYGDAYSVSATASSGLSLTYSIVSGPATISGNSLTFTGAGSVVVKASQAGDATYSPAEATQTITVNKQTLTVTANDKTKVYGDANPALTYSMTGFVNSDYLVSGAPALSTTVTTASNAGTYTNAITATVGTLASSNYNFAFVAGTLTVNKRDITVTVDAKSKTYGSTDPALTYVLTAGTLTGSDAFTGSLSRAPGENAGTYAINQGTLAVSSNYTITFVSRNLTIDKRAITITANVQSKVYGSADPSLTYAITAGSLVGSDALTGSLGRVAGENVGAYAINQGSLNNTNYTITFVSKDLTISKRAITVTTDAKSKIYGGLDPALTYTITAGTLVSGDAFSGSLSRAAGENVGTYAINQGTLALNSNYTLTYFSNNLTINKKAITITAAAKSKMYGDADPALIYTITSGSLVGSDAFTGNLSRAAGENVGTYTINQGTLALSSNYTVTFVSGNLTIDKRAITVTADAKNKVYGDVDPALTYAVTAGNLVGSDAFTGNLSRDAGENVGTYAINKGSLALNSNYTLSYASANLIIEKRAVTITADAVSKTYGDADPELMFKVTGSLVGGDTFTGSLGRTSGENVGAYTINQGTLDHPNYTITFVSDNLTISKRDITVTADAISKAYGDADPVLTYVVSSGTLVGSDVLSGSLNRTAGDNVGSYAINQGTLANSNYTITFVGDNLTISQRAITIKANDAAKVVGQTKTFAGNEYSITSGSLASGDAITGVSFSSTGAAAGAAAGTYDIVPGDVAGISTTNYSITYINGTLTVNACTAATITTQPVSQVKCASENVTFSVVANGTGLTYQWKKGSEPIDGATSASYTITGITAANAGDYSVVVTGSCGSVTSNVATLTVNVVPVPTITASGNTLTSSATIGNQWYKAGELIVGATAQTYQVQATAGYQVKVTAGGCTATSAVFNFVPTRIDGPNAWNGTVVAYPNPVSNVLYVKNNSGRKLQLQLVDVAGVKVRVHTLVGTQGSINVQGLASGAYFLVVTDQQTQQSISINIIKL